MEKHRISPIFIGAIAIVIVAGAILGLTMTNSKDTTTDTLATPTPTATAAAKATATPTTTTISVVKQGDKILPGGFADPTIVPIATGYRLYINTFGKGPSGYLTYTSKDGVSWTKEKDIIIPGVATGRAIVLPTGIRFYYPGMQPIKATDPQADMLSTFSADGLSFKQDAGKILSPQSNAYYVEGPTVFQLPDKTWKMYFNENTVAAGNNRDGKIWGASSTDGLTWTRDAKVTLVAEDAVETTKPWAQVLHPFVVTNPKGGYIMFYNSHSEVFAATSTDGLTWKKLGKIGIHGADVDGYFQADGTFRMYYGGYSETEGGLVYTGVLTIK